MSFPEWIYSNKPGRDLYQREVDLQKALEIAWSTLESYSIIGQYSKADEAMRRISSLGSGGLNG